MARLNAFVGAGKELDDAALAELEEILFSADVGVRTASALLETVRERLKRRELSDLGKVKAALREEIERILSQASGAHGGLPEGPRPQVVMVVGVNGVGQDHHHRQARGQAEGSGRKVVLGSRRHLPRRRRRAARRLGRPRTAPIVRGKDGSDPGAVLFDAVKRARARERGRGARRHRRPPPHQGESDGGAQEGQAHARQGAAGRAARGAPGGGRDQRPERHPAGAAVPRGAGRDRASCSPSSTAPPRAG